MPERHLSSSIHRTCLRGARLAAWCGAWCLAGALAGCAGVPPTASNAGRSSGGVEVFGTLDASVGHVR